MRFLIATSVMAIAPTFVLAEPLWGRVEAGASLAEIKSAYPEGREPDTPSKALKPGAATLQYKIDSVPIAGEQFKVGFYLAGDRLDSVSLTMNADKSGYDCLQTIQAVQEALIAKYGAPVSRDVSQLSTSAAWVAGRTSISLYGSNLSVTKKCSIFLTYNQRIAESADNL